MEQAESVSIEPLKYKDFWIRPEEAVKDAYILSLISDRLMNEDTIDATWIGDALFKYLSGEASFDATETELLRQS